MKSFDSSSDEEEDDNLGLLDFDSDDEEVETFQKPKLNNGEKKTKSVSDKKVFLMSAFATICGK